jgi:hypothetical protein
MCPLRRRAAARHDTVEEPVVLNVASGLGFLGFLAAALLVALSELGIVGPRRRFINVFVAYAVAASFAAGLSQRDAWPFSKWPMAGGRAEAEYSTVRIVGVDEDGVEHGIDYRAWQPMAFDELMPWMHRAFPRLPRASQDRVVAHLLEKAESARRKARAGGGPGYLDRFLGPLAAPEFDLHPRPWSSPEAVAARPFVSLRVYRETWNQEERRRDPSRVARRLLYESRR